MGGLTKQERRVLLAVVLLLIIGGTTKWYRLAHAPLPGPSPPGSAVLQSAKP